MENILSNGIEYEEIENYLSDTITNNEFDLEIGSPELNSKIQKAIDSIEFTGEDYYISVGDEIGNDGNKTFISGRSVGAAALSLLIWPGIGQAVNDCSYEKDVTHAVLGLTGIFRIWSCYDAVVDRKGGVWHNRI